MTSEDDTPARGDRIADVRPRPTPLWTLLSRWIIGLEAWVRSHGGRGLRVSVRVFWGAVAVAGALLLIGPIINPPLSLDDIMTSTEEATDTWIARDFDADYVITRDADGRLRAEVTETITAFFAEDVDEHGIDRSLATEYESHALHPMLVDSSIDGVATPATTRTTADRVTWTLDTGARLQGDHTFVLRYTLQDLAYPATDDATGATVDLFEWGVFGPSWPQAFAGLDVSVTIPVDVAASLVRQPRGAVAWTLVSGGEWLDPEPESPPGTRTYAFTVDQNIPPHAQAWFTFVLPQGTFAMPEPSPLFVVQTFGPLVPLALLIVTLLFALAARAVAWSDARGRPWFVAQSEPPSGVSVAAAAQILLTPRTRELALAVAQSASATGSRRTELLVALGRAASRAGRVGDRIRAAAAFRLDPARRAQQSDGYRRVPRGFVRDWFIAAPLALSLLQLGIIRQLSAQTTLAVIWWPGAFVAASLLITVVVVGIALRARPLTRRGALVRQHLAGIDVFARQTSLLERTTLSESVLPYAVLQADARDAGREIRAHVVTALEPEDALRAWRTRDFVTWPQVVARVLPVVVVAATIAVLVVTPNPYARTGGTYENWDVESRGALYTQVDDVDVNARLELRDDAPHLSVVERVAVRFDDDAPRAPQFAQKLPVRVDGQDLGLVVTGVRVDDVPVSFEVSTDGDLVEVATTMGEVLSGAHTVELAYEASTPVTAGVGSPLSGADGDVVERVRWAALLDGWDSGWAYPSAPTATVTLEVADALLARAVSAGWVRNDPDTAEDARDWRDSVFPFGTIVGELGPREGESADRATTRGVLEESRTAGPDGTVFSLHTKEGEYGYPTNGTYTDLGTLLEFPLGTFGADANVLEANAMTYRFPMLLTVGLGVAGLAVGGVGVIAAAARRSRRFAAGWLREAVWFGTPALALSACIVFVWATADMPGDWPEFPVLFVGALAGVIGAVVGLVAVRPTRPTGGRAARARGRTGRR